MRLATCTAAAALLALLPASVGAQSAFPRSSLQPSPYTGGRVAASSPTLAGAPMAQPAREQVPGGEMVRVDLGGPSGPTRTLALPRGKSAVIELPLDAKDVIVSDAKVADVVLSTPRRIYVMGLTSGQTDAAFFDASGRQLLKLEVRVDQDTSVVTQTLSRVLPGSHVRVDAVNQNIILSGEVANAAEADKAVRIAASFVAKPEQVLNMMSVAASEQVMLKVKIVEVNRSVIKQLGFNTQGILNQLGQPQYLLGFNPTYGINGALLGGLTGGYSFDSTKNPYPHQVFRQPDGTFVTNPGVSLDRGFKGAPLVDGAGATGVNKAQALIQAFERVGLVRTLAEPNLTAVSGESARFLAGGEFPVPVAQDNLGRVTVEFKPFGVGLGFTPVVMSSGRISLKISSEVSEITNVNSFSTGTTSTSSGTSSNNFNIVIPGLNVRRTETTVELPSGGAMMISGLLQSKMAQNLDSLPGLMQLPVLGALFRSRDFVNNESELVVIVTPYLVKPVRPDQLQTPADGLQLADDVTTNLLGRLNKGFGKPATPIAGGRTLQGPYGYVVE